MADPFHWKPNEVVDFLCKSSAEVTEEPEVLAEKILNGRVTGKRLLTFGKLLSEQQLQEHLGLTELWQQCALAEAIEDLRSQSAAFQDWDSKITAARNPRPKERPLGNAENTKSPSKPPRPPASSFTSNSIEPQLDGSGPSQGAILEVVPLSTKDHSTRVSPGNIVGPDRRKHTLSDSSSTVVNGIQQVTPPTKRARIAPINITTETGREPQPSFRTEEDFMGVEAIARANVVNPRILESVGPHTYLGKGALTLDEIRSTSINLSTRLVDHSDGGFVLTLPNVLARGRRLVVHRATKRLLLENLQRENFIRADLEPPSREGSIGLEDLPSDYDEETKREMSIERREREAELSGDLSGERVMQLMDEFTEKVIADWKEFKLPKYERRAFKLWTSSTRRGTRGLDVEDAKRISSRLQSRLERIREEILNTRWQNAADVARQSNSFEATVEDRCYQDWLVQILSSRVQPTRPQQQHMRRRAPRPHKEVSDGEEILLSTDDEDGFIVNDLDGPSELMQTDTEFTSTRPARAQREPSVMDLTVTPQKSGFIDLTISPPGDQSVVHFKEEPNQPPGGDDQELITAALVEAAKDIVPKNCLRTHGKNGMLLSLLWKLNHKSRQRIFAKAKEAKPSSIWVDTVHRYLERISQLSSQEDPEAQEGELQPEDLQTAFDVSRLFVCYYKSRPYAKSKVIGAIKRRLSSGWQAPEIKNSFKVFLRILREAGPFFPQESQILRREPLLLEASCSDEEFADDDPSGGAEGRRRRAAPAEIVQNKEAIDLRERQANRQRILNERAQRLRDKLAVSDAVSSNRTQHIINEAKQEHQGLIYINETTGKRIKPHQIDGVRFLWNQIVQDASDRQGCLLAHTMGLGKTMQVITFLVALHEAANSEDPTVREQVPADMRHNSTLILCPAGLVDNWIEELATWSSTETLGQAMLVSSDMPVDERTLTVEQWAEKGGIIVIGYEMLKQLFDMSEKIAELLTDTPTTVVADEAHRLKNSASKLHRVCSQFKTKSRIALTGSPLANNVDEYYHMIDWVAPNFLGPREEFRNIYSRSIEDGLYHDSTGSEKRNAIKMLQVLKETVAPKVHRATIAALKDDLPNKHEFVISVTATQFQHDLYNACVQVIKSNGEALGQGQVFAIMGILSLICNHPKCLYVKVKEFREKAKGDVGVFSPALATTVLTMTRGRDIDDPALSSKMKLLTEILDQARAAKDKVLVFSTSIPTLQYLQYVLRLQKRKVSLLDGGTSISVRQRQVAEFNSTEKEVYLISTRAGGVGLNIQGANRVILFDFKWNPMDEQQAIGRAYRIGQRKTVYVYRFVVAGTFEESLHNKAIFKTQLASRVVDKKNPISWSKRGGQLIHEIKASPQTDLSPFKGKDDILDQIISDHSNVVKSIMSTDTFEEEDHTATLTPAELKETDKLVYMNRLRMADPAAWQREMELHRLNNVVPPASIPSMTSAHARPTPLGGHALQPGVPEPGPTALRPSQISIPTHSGEATYEEASSLLQSMDGASDYPFVRSKTSGGVFGLSSTRGGPKLRYHELPEMSLDIPTPPPIAGANTFFGNQSLAQVPEQPSRIDATQRPFQRSWSVARREFERSFINHAMRLRDGWSKPQRFTHAALLSIAEEVDHLRREKHLGFLPDDLQWKSLTSHLDNPRFTAAAAHRRFRPQWLAFVNHQDIEARLHTLDEMSEVEFFYWLEGNANSTDPVNFDNIRRPDVGTPGTPRGPHLTEDIKAMRAAADKRRTLNAHLPTWALDALPTTSRR